MRGKMVATLCAYVLELGALAIMWDVTWRCNCVYLPVMTGVEAELSCWRAADLMLSFAGSRGAPLPGALFCAWFQKLPGAKGEICSVCAELIGVLVAWKLFGEVIAGWHAMQQSSDTNASPFANHVGATSIVW